MAKFIEKPLTKKDLVEFTEETLLPAVERIIDERVSKVDTKINTLDAKVNKLDEKINTTKLDLMDFIEDKISDLRGEIILLLRKEDRRFLHLVKVLHQKQILSKDDIKSIDEFGII